MNKSAKLAELRHSLARYGLPPDRAPVPLGHPQADAVLGGGLRPGALHEVFAGGWSAGGFAALLALLTAGKRPFFWVRPDYEAMEYGALSPNGLAELGGDPRQLILVRTRNAADALSAANDILACPHVGALLLEMEGMPKCLDLVASRRLAFAAGESGVTVLVLRNGAHAEPSAALTRWQVASAPSPVDDDDWGNPVFDARLIRHRLGGLGNFLMQWNPEHACFDTADIGAVVCRACRPTGLSARMAARRLKHRWSSAQKSQTPSMSMRWRQRRPDSDSIKASPWPMPGPWCSRCAIVPADEKADAALLEGIADWCDRFTPLVTLDAPDGLFLDITGAAHLFGGEAAMLAMVTQKIADQGFAVRGAIAGTSLSARALARFSPATIVPPGGEAAAMAPLPITALDCDDKILRALRHAGLKTIGMVAERLHSELSERLGKAFVTRLKVMLGAAEQPLQPRRPLPDLMAEQRFAEPIVTEEAIAASLLSLAHLERNPGAPGARRAHCWKPPSSAPTARWSASPSRPASRLRDPKVMLRLLRQKLDALADPLDPGFGFDLIRLEALLAEETRPGTISFRQR